VTDLQGFREQFPALERVVWLNTATTAPGARPVLEAFRAALARWEDGSFSWQGWEAEAYATRPLFARMIGAREEDVALFTYVAEAAATVAASLPPGRVVVGEREFQSNLFPWLALKDRGFDVVQVPATDGVVRTETLAEAVAGGTVLVAVTDVQSSNGFRVRLPDLAARCREVGARLFVDLAQSVGALRFDAEGSGADFAVAPAYKWLVGPRGATWMWVRPDRLAELRPLAPNWHSVAEPYAEYYGGPMNLAPDARRLDTSMAWLSWVGARPALELLGSIDPEAVEARALELARAFREGADEAGLSLVPEDAPSQVVGVSMDDPDAVRERMKRLGVVGAVRGGFLRLGFHGFNDRSDVERGLEALGRAGS
jgi:selenocysteine lyase/cysteine desulfurase